MESTKGKRVWHKGPPPHIGWWNANDFKDKKLWRWWNGRYWSAFAHEHDDSRAAEYKANAADEVFGAPQRHNTNHKYPIFWCDYWPENARVPRIDPKENEMWTDDEIAEAREWAQVDQMKQLENIIAMWRKNGRWDDALIDVQAWLDKAEELQ